MKAAIFDLDGTLIDPTEGIAAAYRHVSSVLGLPPPELERICDEIGPPIRDAVSSLFGLRKSEVEQAVATFREYYGRRGVQQFVPYAGVSDALKRLRHDGFLLRIATSKLARYASEIVARVRNGAVSSTRFAGRARSRSQRRRRRLSGKHSRGLGTTTHLSCSSAIAGRIYSLLGRTPSPSSACRGGSRPTSD